MKKAIMRQLKSSSLLQGKSGPVDPETGLKFPWIYPALYSLTLAVLLFFSRFYRLTALSSWPRHDESLCGALAIRLMSRWDWTLRQLGFLVTPLSNWGMALFFQVLGPSLKSLWLYPALESSLAVGAGYLAARQFLNQRTSLVFAIFMAGSFWPAYAAKFALPLDAMLLMENLSFLALGVFLNHKGLAGRPALAALVGFLTGLVFYASLPCGLIAAVISFAMAARCLTAGGPRRGGYLSLGCYAGVLAAALAPLFLDILARGMGNYNTSALATHWDAQQARVAGAYLGSIFLSRPGAAGDYSPIGGAFLNPVLTLFFLAGLVKMWVSRKEPLFQGLGWCLLLALGPTFLTGSLEYFRTANAMPFALALGAIGADSIFEILAPPKRLWLCALIALSLAWDGYRLLVLYPGEWSVPNSNWAENYKSIRGWRAFGVLSYWEKNRGPGCYLGNLDTQTLDQSLAIATFPFNAAENGKYSLEDSGWVAVLTNLHYMPFLKTRFPECRIYSLDWEHKGRYGGDVLFVAPMSGPNRPVFLKWFALNQKLQESTDEIMDRYQSGPRNAILEELGRQEAYAQGDPFLESCLWEKIYTQLNYEVAWGEVPFTANRPALAYALREALQKGYPAAHLWNELGNILWTAGRTAEAKQAFENALRAPLNLTKAAEHLRQLQNAPRP